ERASRVPGARSCVDSFCGYLNASALCSLSLPHGTCRGRHAITSRPVILIILITSFNATAGQSNSVNQPMNHPTRSDDLSTVFWSCHPDAQGECWCSSHFLFITFLTCSCRARRTQTG